MCADEVKGKMFFPKENKNNYYMHYYINITITLLLYMPFISSSLLTIYLWP